MPLTPEERAHDEEAIRELEAQIAEHRARLGIPDSPPIAQTLHQIGDRVDTLTAAVQPVPPRPQYRFTSSNDVLVPTHDDEAVRQEAIAARDHVLDLAAANAPASHRPRWQGDKDVPFVDPYGHDMMPQEAREAAQRRGAEAIQRQDQQRRR